MENTPSHPRAGFFATPVALRCLFSREFRMGVRAALLNELSNAAPCANTSGRSALNSVCESRLKVAPFPGGRDFAPESGASAN